MTAITDLTALVSNLPNASLLTDTMKNDALAGALIPDSFNLWPAQDGYEATYDIYFAAQSLVAFLMAQPVVRQSSSEGTSVAVDAPSWGALLAYYRSMSPISRVMAGDVLRVARIPDGPHVVPVNMTEAANRSDGYDNVDTDLA